MEDITPSPSDPNTHREPAKRGHMTPVTTGKEDDISLSLEHEQVGHRKVGTGTTKIGQQPSTKGTASHAVLQEEITSLIIQLQEKLPHRSHTGRSPR